jgi:hypothetical protein
MKHQILKHIISTSFHRVALHEVKVGVLSMLSMRRIMGPVLYPHTVNSERYVRQILQTD